MDHDIERYLNIRTAGAPSVSDDGTLAFLMDTTGVPQVWTLEAPRQWPEQMTFEDERVTFASWSPERSELIYGMDKGGNERVQFYRLEPESGIVMALTARPSAKHLWGGWSHDGEHFAFASNRRDQSVFDIHIQARTDTEARLVHEGDGWISPVGWSPEDDRIIVHESFASFDHELHILDLDSESLTPISDAGEPVRYESPDWDPTGDAIWLASDIHADTTELVRHDLESGTFETVRTGGDWNVESIVIDQESGRLVYTRNVEGYTEVSVCDITEDGLEDRCSPRLPEGVAGGISFFPEARSFAIAAQSRQQNANVYVVDAITGEATRWTNASTAGIQKSTFRSPTLVKYETFDGREIPALWTIPDQASEGEKPVIVDIHGGPESQRRPSFSGVQQYFLSRGFALFEPNVRGSSGYGRSYTSLDDVENRMDSVADIGAGLEWLKTQEAVDSDRIVAMGGSYGGFMVLASLIEFPDEWAAGVDIVGIANFVSFLENTGDWRRELREAEYGSLEADRSFLEEISPINNIDAIEAPLFVLHGDNDPRVPVGEAEQIIEALRERNVPVRKLIFEDEGHGFSKLENRIEAYASIAEFLETHVMIQE